MNFKLCQLQVKSTKVSEEKWTTETHVKFREHSEFDPSILCYANVSVVSVKKEKICATYTVYKHKWRVSAYIASVS